MRVFLLYTSLLVSLIVSTGVLRAQEEICRMEEGKLIFILDKNWSEEEKREVSTQFGLDSLLIEMVLSSKGGGTFSHEKETWNLKQLGAGKIELSKSMGSLDGKIDWDKHPLISPEEPGQPLNSGPGYVNMDEVIFGVNKLKKNVIIQYPSGSTKFILPGYEKAKEVLISGSFNGWSTSELPLTKTAEGWTTTLNLKPGKYLYKYIVDGNWIKDPNNLVKEDDGWKGYNSVFYKYNKKFKLPGYENAKNVYLAGSFNGWNPKRLPMNKTALGWIISIYLKEGTHAYKYVVDGNWILDPKNPVKRSDGAGNYNSFTAVGDTTIFALTGFPNAKEVYLAGNFNGWNSAELAMEKKGGKWILPYVLAPGNYEYKYVVDGSWIIDPGNPYVIHQGDEKNSFLAIEPNYTFTFSKNLNARSVIVTGSFTGWSEENNRMVKKGGKWIFPMHLKPGKHLYKLIVDGEWIIDPDNPAYEENEFDTGNSVLWIEQYGDL